MMTLRIMSRSPVFGSVLILILLLGCSNTTDHSSTISPGRSTATSAHRNTQLLQACDSVDFALSESELAAADKISGEEETQRTFERYTNPNGGLSLYLDLIQDTIAYAEPVSFRLTVTNDTEQPIIFCRPQGVTIENQPSLAGLIVNLHPVSGEWKRPIALLHRLC